MAGMWRLSTITDDADFGEPGRVRFRLHRRIARCAPGRKTTLQSDAQESLFGAQG